MDEIIVNVVRTVACRMRLRVLSRLAQGAETTPTVLAAELRLPLGLLCSHLRRLSSAGLIRRRRSGLYCYCVAQSPYGHRTLSGAFAAWLYQILRSPSEVAKLCGAHRGGNDHATAPRAQLENTLFDAATAMTNVRRLHILRRLAKGDAVPLERLASELKMSPSAASRHTSKLVRRGYVEVIPVGRELACRLAKRFKTPIHTRMLQIVQAQWDKEPLHS